MQATIDTMFVNEKIIRKYSFCPFSPRNTRQMHLKSYISPPSWYFLLPLSRVVPQSEGKVRMHLMCSPLFTLASVFYRVSKN